MTNLEKLTLLDHPTLVSLSILKFWFNRVFCDIFILKNGMVFKSHEKGSKMDNFYNLALIRGPRKLLRSKTALFLHIGLPPAKTPGSVTVFHRFSFPFYFH